MNIVLLAACLALPLPAAFAQPPAKPAPAPQVQIKVEFATASIADLDNLAVFDKIPFTLPAPGTKMSVEAGRGNIARQLYEAVTRISGRLVALPLLITPDNVLVAAPVDQKITTFTSKVVSGNPTRSPLLLKRLFQVRGKLTIIPHVLPGNSIALDTQPQVSLTEAPAASPPALGDGIPFLLRTIAVGETMVIRAPLTETDTTGIPILGSLFRTRNRQTDPQALLLFLTPTVISQTTQAQSHLPDSPVSTDPAPTRWFKIALQHNRAGDLVKTMRWSALNSGLPDGVVQVDVTPEEDHTLFVQAAPEGYNSLRKIVQIVDGSAQSFRPRVSFFSVSQQESGLHYYDGPTSEIEAATDNDGVITAAFQQLTESGHSPVLLKALHESDSADPQSWTVNGISISWLRLNSDDTLTLQIGPADGQEPPQTMSRIRRGGIIVVRQRGSPLNTFLKVDW